MKKITVPVLLCVIGIFAYGCINDDVARYNREKALEQSKGQVKSKQPPANSLSYTLVEYDDLPEDIKVLVNLQEKQPLVKTIKGKGNNTYVFISLGERPTGGYAVKITNVKIANGTVVISYKEVKPPKDAVVTQQLTYPWVVLKVVSPLPVGKIIKEE